MKESSLFNNHSFHSKTVFCLIPEDILETLVSNQDKILEFLGASKGIISLNGFITEKQAMEAVNKKATWFWQARKSGKLPFKKIGKTIYYSQGDINSLLENN
jgi:hypothetical protein